MLGAPGSEGDSLDAALGLGELASLTVNNEADTSYDVSIVAKVFLLKFLTKYECDL